MEQIPSRIELILKRLVVLGILATFKIWGNIRVGGIISFIFYQMSAEGSEPTLKRIVFSGL